MSQFSNEIFALIEEAQTQGLEETPPSGILTGFSGEKLTGLLQRLPKVTGKDYLEVGTYQGSSLLHAALANPNIICYGIDNFIAHDSSGTNKETVIKRAGELGLDNYRLVEKDFEEALADFKEEIGTYFIDGPHDYRSQFICLAYAPKFLARNGVILVDDANYAHVRQATADFLTFWPEYKLVFEAYTDCHPINMTREQLQTAKSGWWDGVHVIVHDPDDTIDGLSPPVPGNARFIRDHDVHSARWAPVAAYALDTTSAIVRPWELPRAFWKTLRERVRQSGEIKGRFRFANTESQGLPTRMAHPKT